MLRCILPAFIWIVTPARLPAQDSAVRQSLATFRTALETTTETGEVTRLRRAFVGDRDAKDMANGMATVRIATLRRSISEMESALGMLQAIAASRTDWPWPHLAMAEGYRALHFMSLPLIPLSGLKEGESYSAGFWRALRESIKRDPSFDAARQVGMHALLASGERTPWGDDEAFLEEVRRAFPEDPDVAIVDARRARQGGGYDVALSLLAKALRLGGDTSVIHLERARTRRAVGDTVGAVTGYYDGLKNVSFRGRQLYRHDLGYLLAPDSLKAYDAVPDALLQDWLRRFWAHRDAVSTNAPNGRLSDHLARWVVAHRNFRLPAPWRRTQFQRVELDFERFYVECIGNIPEFFERLSELPPVLDGDLRSEEQLLDHRGLILMRHGPPMARVIGTHRGFGGSNVGAPERRIIRGGLTVEDDRESAERVVAAARHESWLYWIEGRWRFLHFRPSEALGTYAPTTLGSILPADREDYEALGLLVADYAAAAWNIRRGTVITRHSGQIVKASTPACDVVPLLSQSRVDATLSILTDTDSPFLSAPYNASFSAFALGTGDSGNLVVAFGVQTDRLVRDSTTDVSRGGVYRAKLRLTGFGHRTGRTLEVERDFEFTVPGAQRPGATVSGLLEVPLSDDTWDIGLLLHQGREGHGAYDLIRGLYVPGPSGLAISDLVTSLRGTETSFLRPSGRVAASPYASLKTGSSLELFFEVYGVAAGGTFKTSFEIKPASGSGRSIRLSTTDQSSGEVTDIRRTLNLKELREGLYRLTARVTAQGKTVERERLLMLTP